MPGRGNSNPNTLEIGTPRRTRMRNIAPASLKASALGSSALWEALSASGSCAIIDSFVMTGGIAAQGLGRTRAVRLEHKLFWGPEVLPKSEDIHPRTSELARSTKLWTRSSIKLVPERLGA